MSSYRQPEKDRGTRRAGGSFRRFTRDRSGATAIEFTILALPFMLLIFAILESCISFAGQQILANATDDVARQLRTGQIKAAEMTEAKLKTMICADLGMLVSNCDKDNKDLLVDLRQYDTFADAALVKTKYTSDKDIDTTGFDIKPGPALSINMLRVFYKWPVMTDIMRQQMSNLKDNKTLQFAAVAWRNEPFPE